MTKDSKDTFIIRSSKNGLMFRPSSSKDSIAVKFCSAENGFQVKILVQEECLPDESYFEVTDTSFIKMDEANLAILMFLCTCMYAIYSPTNRSMRIPTRADCLSMSILADSRALDIANELSVWLRDNKLYFGK